MYSYMACICSRTMSHITTILAILISLTSCATQLIIARPLRKGEVATAPQRSSDYPPHAPHHNATI